ncbi:tetratricopeptide repeat protein [bacterium]|nr:tetratricopeptide repeat protein [bacterium]
MSRIAIPALSTLLVSLTLLGSSPAVAQGPLRGSIIEDRAARKLMEAGDARYEADEASKAVEIWQSVLERYPTSRVRYEAHMRLGNYFLDRDRAYDKARVQFEEVASEENRDEEQRAEATLKMGICFYEARNFGKCFSVMRDVIEHFPVSKQVNQAYYYIGLGHFQLGHYSRAIDALEKVGTSMGSDDEQLLKVEAGKRLFVKIEDADLAALEPGTPVTVQCEATSGDVEPLKCFSVGRNVRIVLGSIPTALGSPQKGNGRLEVKGDDKVKVVYIDQHTADKQFDRKVLHEVTVVGNGIVSVTDGAFAETLQGVVLGKPVNLQTIDADRDLTDAADQVGVVVELLRAKTDEEIEQETIALLGGKEGDRAADDEELKIDRFKKIDSVELTLTEAVVETIRPADEVAPAGDAVATTAETAASDAGSTASGSAESGATVTPAVASTPANPDAVHSGVFRTIFPLARAEEVTADDDTLQALPGDVIRIVYQDDRNTSEEARVVRTEVKCIEGNLGGVRVTRTQISDRELRVRTKLKTAHALTNIANRYKEFGLKKNADAKYESALTLCEEIMTEARQLGGRLLEETYVQLWKIYFEMDRLELAAAMAQRLQRDFPNSGFVDDALLQLADVAVEQGNLNRAIGIYNRLVNMQTSQLRGEAQFGVAECYEKMADAAQEAQATQLYDRAFQEYKKVFDQFPDSGRVGEAVARMANHYYRQKDYARAIDTFETVLANHPDAKFLDVILFNYGRCLYRMNKRADARRRFDQLIGDYPESALAADARKISEALAKAGF